MSKEKNERLLQLETEVTDLRNDNKKLKEQISMLREENLDIKSTVRNECVKILSEMLPSKNLQRFKTSNEYDLFDFDKYESSNDTEPFSGNKYHSDIKEKDDELTRKMPKQKRLLSTAVIAPSQLDGKIAFSAALSTRVSLGQHQTIEYDQVLTNIGNAYDLRHGHFIAPVKGIYLMSFTLMSMQGTDIYLEMVKNGKRIAYVYGDSADFNMSSQTILVLLEKGDMVWVRHSDANTRQIHEDGYNTFSGAFLFHV